jgi:hypothetical protein
MAKLEDLRRLGFSWVDDSSFSASVRLVNNHEQLVTIEYRPGKGVPINSNSDIDFNKFSLNIFGGSAVNGTPINITCLQDIISFKMFFNQ